MRASPRISVLGEGGDPCTVGNGPSKDHKSVILFWRWLPFHQLLLMCVSLTTVVEWATQTFLLQQETVSRGDLLLSGKFNLPVSNYFCRLFSPHLYLFPPDPISFCNVLQPLKIFSGLCQENVFSMPALFAVSFRCRFILRTDENRIQK